MGDMPSEANLEIIVDVSYDNFEDEVLSADLPVVVEYGHMFCAPCLKMQPHFRKLSGEFYGRMIFASYDLLRYMPFRRKKMQENVQYAKEVWGIQSAPTLIVYRNGREITRSIGYLSEQQLREFLEGSLEETKR